MLFFNPVSSVFMTNLFKGFACTHRDSPNPFELGYCQKTTATHETTTSSRAEDPRCLSCPQRQNFSKFLHKNLSLQPSIFKKAVKHARQSITKVAFCCTNIEKSIFATILKDVKRFNLQGTDNDNKFTFALDILPISEAFITWVHCPRIHRPPSRESCKKFYS